MTEKALNGSISKEDLKLFLFTDSNDEMVGYIHQHAIKRFGLVKKEYKPNWLFGERAKNFKGKQHDNKY